MPDSRPRIVFNDDGICNACINAENKKNIDWSKRIKVLPWPIIPDQNKKELVREGTDHIHEIK